MKNTGIFLLSILFLAGISSCGPGEPEHIYEPDYFDLPDVAYFPTLNNIPNNNRLSRQGVSLGKCLFYDTCLSGSGVSCASCHRPQNGFDAGRDNERLADSGMRGAGGITARVPLPLVNLAYNLKSWGWTGEMSYAAGKNLEDFIKTTLCSNTELGYVSDSALLARVTTIETYPPLFEAAFGSNTISVERISFALAQYVRTLVSSNSRFDRYMRGEETLTDEELKGYALFTTEEGADCFHCHGGAGNVLFTTYAMENNGLDEVSRRVPTLRNISRTAPYMHDGRFRTLEEVIDYYSEGVQASPQISPLMHHAAEGGVQLTPAEKQCLKAFLLTLDDKDFLHNN